MTKTEILEAINIIIAPNNQKAITADMLANILIEVVNAIPEASDIPGSSNSEAVVIYPGTPLDDGSFEQTDEEKIHNAQVYQICKNAQSLPTIQIDLSKLYELMMGVEDIKFNTVALMSAFFVGDTAQEIAGVDEALLIAGEMIGEVIILENGSVIAQFNA